MNIRKVVLLMCLTIATTGCSAVNNVVKNAPIQDPTVTLVSTGSVKACPSATLGDMANAFFGSPRWSSFTATSGETIVELTGEMSYNDLPATAKLQFTVDALRDSFETSYLSINDSGQSILMISGLFTKMCDAV